MVQHVSLSNGTRPKGLGTPFGMRGDSQPLHEYPARALRELVRALAAGFPEDGDDFRAESNRCKAAIAQAANDPAKLKSIEDDLKNWKKANYQNHKWQDLIKAALQLPKLWSPDQSQTTLLATLTKGDSDDPRRTLDAWLDSEGYTTLASSVRTQIQDTRHRLDYNARRALESPEIVTLLIARTIAKDVKPASLSAESLFLTLTRPEGAWQEVYQYALRRSAWFLSEQRYLSLDSDKAEGIVQHLGKSSILLSREAFESSLVEAYAVVAAGKNTPVDEYVKRIEARTGTLRAGDRQALSRYLDDLPPDQLSDDNLGVFVGRTFDFLRTRSTLGRPAAAPDSSVDDYGVEYYDDATSSLEFDRTSVQAAAQLYFVSVWGDELGLFETIDRIASQSSPELRLDLTSKETLQDLQLYVLDERFRDGKTGEVFRRVPRAERGMFYRQVFGMGDDEATGMRTNGDFARLWAVLMNATAAYIQKIEESIGNQMVSPQKIIQSVEDLRYSLSMACSGMAKVAAPVIYKEMDFVIRKLLGSKDITSLVGGGSFWKVVERVRGPQQLTPLRTKGRVGHQIISMIATEDLSNEEALSKFVMAVEAYIVAESQLVQAPQGPSTNYEDYAAPQPVMPGQPNGGDATNGVSNWDF